MCRASSARSSGTCRSRTTASCRCEPRGGQLAWLHASCTEWKNLFCFEIFGRDGKLQIDGLGGSYGVERLSFYRMLPQMGPPETTIWEYPGEDRSWRRPSSAHLPRSACAAGRQPDPGHLEDALAALGSGRSKSIGNRRLQPSVANHRPELRKAI